MSRPLVAFSERYVVNASVEKIRVPSNRLRELRDYSGLAASMERLGLLSPITITEGGILVTGRHRLEAAKSLGWQTIPAFVVEDDELENRLQEIDENLRRLDLTVYEQAKHADEREVILGKMLVRRAAGRHPNPAAVAGLAVKTADVAKEAGMSERSWQGRVKIGQALGEQTRAVLDHADPTDEKQRNLLNSTTQLDHLANIAKKHGDEEAAKVAEQALSEDGGNTFKAYETIKREKTAERRTQELEKNREQVAAGSVALPTDTFKTIVLDPPWDWGDEGDVDQFGRGRPVYGTMPLSEIAALPIGELAEQDAHIYLWITNRSLPKGFALLEEWGFRYVTCVTWVKPSYGMGNYFRGSTEHVLFGVRGSLPLSRHDLGTHFEAPRAGKHSAKPPEFYEMVESASPGPFLEMFARSDRPGWKAWGAEARETGAA